jgi:hypothetical protein
MAAWKGTEPKTVTPPGNVFIENGLGVIPHDPQTGTRQTDVSREVNPPRSTLDRTQNNVQPLAATGPGVQSVLDTARSAQPISKEIKSVQTAAEETTRAVSASKSLFPDER